MKEMNGKYSKNLLLAVDMYGCPNRCRHCWLGHMPNRKMETGADEWIVGYFKPYFEHIGFYNPGAHCIYTDTAWCKFLCKCLCESIYTTFGCGINRFAAGTVAAPY